MKALVVLALTCGCGIDTSGLARPSSDATDEAVDARPVRPTDAGQRTDGSRDARTEPSDAGTDAFVPVDAYMPAPTWTVIETMTVDSASSSPTYSTSVLAAGVVYRLRASGTIMNVIDSFQGDADYYDFSAPKDNGCCEDIGLGIDDFVVDDLDTQPDWGPYDPTHVYEVDWTGDGTTIAALFQDTYYGNNIGLLTLEILELR